MKIANIVEQTLREHPETRNSDKKLIFRVFERLGCTFTAEQKEIMSSVSMETIRRIRQKLQEQGKYKADKDVATVRRIKSQVVQQNVTDASPGRLETLFDADNYNVKPRREFI